MLRNLFGFPGLPTLRCPSSPVHPLPAPQGQQVAEDDNQAGGDLTLRRKGKPWLWVWFNSRCRWDLVVIVVVLAILQAWTVSLLLPERSRVRENIDSLIDEAIEERDKTKQRTPRDDQPRPPTTQEIDSKDGSSGPRPSVQGSL